jgi:DNA-binding transcriptional LysR family regulator
MNALAIHGCQTKAGASGGVSAALARRPTPANRQGLRHEAKSNADAVLVASASPASAAQFSYPRHIPATDTLLPSARGRRFLLPRRRAGNSGRGFGLDRLQFGFVGSLNELADIVTLDRAGAYHGRRPRVLCPPDHLDRQVIDPAKSHVPVPSSAVSVRPNTYRTPEPKCWKPLPTRTIAR